MKTFPEKTIACSLAAANGFSARRVRVVSLAIFVLATWVPTALADSPGEVIASGRGTARFVQKALLTFGDSGRIEHIDVDEGDIVQQGDLLASLFDDTAVAALQEAKAAASRVGPIEVARQELVAASQQYDAVKRANQLHPRAFSTVREKDLRTMMDRAKELVRQQEEDVQLAELGSETAEAQLASLHLKAPFGGTIVRRLKNPGEGAGPLDPVLELVNDKTIRVDTFVSPRSAAMLSVGNLARLTLADDEPKPRSISETATGEGSPAMKTPSPEPPSTQGTIGFIDLTVQPVRRVVRVWVELERPDWLRDGMQLDVEFLRAGDKADDPADVEKPSIRPFRTIGFFSRARRG